MFSVVSVPPFPFLFHSLLSFSGLFCSAQVFLFHRAACFGGSVSTLLLLGCVYRWAGIGSRERSISTPIVRWHLSPRVAATTTVNRIRVLRSSVGITFAAKFGSGAALRRSFTSVSSTNAVLSSRRFPCASASSSGFRCRIPCWWFTTWTTSSRRIPPLVVLPLLVHPREFVGLLQFFSDKVFSFGSRNGGVRSDAATSVEPHPDCLLPPASGS